MGPTPSQGILVPGGLFAASLFTDQPGLTLALRAVGTIATFGIIGLMRRRDPSWGRSGSWTCSPVGLEGRRNAAVSPELLARRLSILSRRSTLRLERRAGNLGSVMPFNSSRQRVAGSTARQPGDTPWVLLLIFMGLAVWGLAMLIWPRSFVNLGFGRHPMRSVQQVRFWGVFWVAAGVGMTIAMYRRSRS